MCSVDADDDCVSIVGPIEDKFEGALVNAVVDGGE